MNGNLDIKSANDSIIFDASLGLNAIGVYINAATKFSVDSTGIVNSAGQIKSANGVDLGTSKALTGTTAITIGSGTATTAITSSDWAIGATGIATGLGNITSDGDFVTTKKVDATDSLCLGNFRFVVVSDTLVSITGTDTLRIHPSR
jgi:hypothetical protein